jgi:hypothetical protein
VQYELEPEDTAIIMMQKVCIQINVQSKAMPAPRPSRNAYARVVMLIVSQRAHLLAWQIRDVLHIKDLKNIYIEEALRVIGLHCSLVTTHSSRLAW